MKPNTAATGQRAHKTLNIKNKSSIKNKPPEEIGDVGNLKRPNTTAMGVAAGTRFAAGRPFTGINTTGDGLTNLGNFIGGRAISANYAVINPKLRRFENLIYRLKKVLEAEKKQLRQVKTLCAKEIEQRNFLEKILRQCVDDVKNEIQKKRSEGKV